VSSAILFVIDAGAQGRYIPLFASAVYDLNARLVSGGYTPINLTSVMIGECVVTAQSSRRSRILAVFPFLAIRDSPASRIVDPPPTQRDTWLTRAGSAPRALF
jgi:hypothetical protein